MESFFRYVAYVDYYKDGEKIRNVGFLKWKLADSVHTIEIGLKGLPECKRCCCIRELGSGKELGILCIEQGMSFFEKKFPDKIASKDHYIELEAGRLYLKEIQGFEIEIEAGKYLKVAVEFEEDRNQEFVNYQESILKKDIEEIEVSDSREKKTQEKEIKKEENVFIHGIPEKYEVPIVEKEIQIIKPIPENKWDLLCQEYPIIHPFGNGRKFLMIKPKDFLVLRQEYQTLVNNSFLLHGFYNYGHMILGRLTQEENGQIYIGVPGVYYDREKQAAQMFGFVGFEGTTKPVQQGSFGYYMIEVEI